MLFSKKAMRTVLGMTVGTFLLACGVGGIASAEHGLSGTNGVTLIGNTAQSNKREPIMLNCTYFHATPAIISLIEREALTKESSWSSADKREAFKNLDELVRQQRRVFKTFSLSEGNAIDETMTFVEKRCVLTRDEMGMRRGQNCVGFVTDITCTKLDGKSLIADIAIKNGNSLMDSIFKSISGGDTILYRLDGNTFLLIEAV